MFKSVYAELSVVFCSTFSTQLWRKMGKLHFSQCHGLVLRFPAIFAY